ncbi:hypothetical protein BGZ95_006285, partial [Linnemannia exigua]
IEFPGWTPQGAATRQGVESTSGHSHPFGCSGYAALAGKFWPIEGILKNGKWDTTIERTETVITPWKDRQHQENLCGELNRLETKIADNPKLFTSWPLIEESLEFFLFRHHLLDAPSIAFGHIKLFGGTSRTVLDKPLTLKATINYFQEKDPSLVSTAERAMLHSDNASRTSRTDPSKVIYVSGPDIMFYVKINGNFYFVYVQLKLSQVLEASDVEEALATVSSHAVQDKMEEEQEKMEKEQEKLEKEQRR